ncbi:MAG: cell division protein ZipA C-terminal FtsZ-binding domain-containing protein [Rhodocyclaceae bacterium]
MTELQMGLIGLGVTAVVGVLAYNKWQEHRHRKVAEQVLGTPHDDVLLGASAQAAQADPFPDDDLPVTANVDLAPLAGRIEPSMYADPVSNEPSNEPAVLAESLPAEALPARHDFPAADAFPAAVTLPASSAPVRGGELPRDDVPPFHLLSPVIDYVVAFEAIEPAPAYQILRSQRDALLHVRKPIHWIGYNERSHEWEPIIDDGESEYRRIRVGLQLVDRSGPLRDGDLSVFHIAMQDLADELMAVADLPSRQPALDSAAQLDQFCAGIDIQIGINVISQGQSFPGTKLRALAEAAGMALDVEGRFVRCDDDGQVLYLLINQEDAGFSAESMKAMSTHGVTFLLDVPRVAHGDRVFNQMIDLARRFAEALHGSLVDDNRRPLSEVALEPIRRQVAQYQMTMAESSLPAGGPLALRLFA